MEMKNIIDKLYNVGLMKDAEYIEFNNLNSELIESETKAEKHNQHDRVLQKACI